MRDQANKRRTLMNKTSSENSVKQKCRTEKKKKKKKSRVVCKYCCS